MTNKLPYEIVAIEANKIIVRAALSECYINFSNNYDMYLAFLKACGWDDQTYTDETLRRIERTWDSLFNYKLWN